MIKQVIVSLAIALNATIAPLSSEAGLIWPIPQNKMEVLGEQTMDLGTRARGKVVNDVFRDNIILALHYLNGEAYSQGGVDWEAVREPFEVLVILEPGEMFAFHETLLDEFDQAEVTMNTDYLTPGGYKTILGLSGNGVCHLATLINWVASEAGLEVKAPVPHDFVPIPEAPREYGTSIRTYDKRQNLYITNTLDSPVAFFFSVSAEKMTLKIMK